MKVKRIFSLLLVLALACTLLTGCIGNYVVDEEEGLDLTDPAEILALDRTTQDLEVWYAVSGTSGEKFLELSERFDAQSDLVNLTYSYSGNSQDTATKVSAALMTDTYPDVALMYAGPLYTGGRGDFTIDGLMKLDSTFNQSDIYSGMLSYCNYMGSGISAVPYGISTQVMYYNKNILAAAGVDMTNPPKTWAEFKEVCLKVLESGNIANVDDFYAFDTSDEAWLYKSMLKQNGCEIVELGSDNTITPVYNNEAGVEVAEYWESLITSKIMPVGQHDNAEKKFLSQGCAFIAASSNRISRWEGTDLGFEVGAIEMPYFKTQTLALGGNVLVILTTDPQKVAAAWEYISYLTSAEVNAEFALATGYLPIRQSEMNLDSIKDAIANNEMYSIAFKQLDYTYSYIHFEQMGTMDVYIRSWLDELERGQDTAANLLNKYQEKLVKEIATDASK